MKQVYLDHAATSPMHQAVIDSMLPVMREGFGNPSSIHGYGRKTRHLVDEARFVAAKSIGAKETEIVFTSGGTEADNLAILGVARANRARGNHIITTQIEHHAVLHTCEQLEREGFEVTYLPVNEEGLVNLKDLEAALRDDTILVTIMYGNNEVGIIQPIKEIGQMLKEHRAYFHTDAVQAFGLLPINVDECSIDFLSVSAHKISGPKGVGFLYARSGTNFSPLSFGGEQERKRRAGTENVAAIVGLKTSIELSMEEAKEKASLYTGFKKTMQQIWQEEGVHFEVNAGEGETLPHVMNVYFPGTNVETLLVNLDLAGIAVSSGSACTAGSIDPSHVLVAMFGKESDRIASSIRFSFGLGNSEEDIIYAANTVAKVVQRLAKK
ncbi:Cysteine desulfurase [Bacillus sp. THAF10]|uniref:cysteine desulfurase family protein n=1 Tax=Bacillus sp. THAF10 TaxID=2587848 RepID=UPI001267FEE8|nr:cysteine desulfurase family protein [Bacillus sp. THAF10]QFT89991.1 Cysteine desulfurase [Bacillus sp. THAF10]